MAAPVDSLEGKVEFSLLAVLSDAGLEEYGLLLCGHEFEEQEGAQIVIACFGGPEVVYNSGNYLMRTRIMIRSPMDREPNETQVLDPREKHREIVQLVRAAIHTETIEADLTGHEADFTCNVIYPADTDSMVEGRFFVTNLEYEVDCVRADFA